MPAKKVSIKPTLPEHARFAAVSSKDGEHGRIGVDAQLADLSAKTFSESRRTGDGQPK